MGSSEVELDWRRFTKCSWQRAEHWYFSVGSIEWPASCKAMELEINCYYETSFNLSSSSSKGDVVHQWRRKCHQRHKKQESAFQGVVAVLVP